MQSLIFQNKDVSQCLQSHRQAKWRIWCHVKPSNHLKLKRGPITKHPKLCNPVPEEPKWWISHKISLMPWFSFPILVIHNGQWLSKVRVDGLAGAKGVRWERQISLTAGEWNEVLQKQGVQSQRHSVELQVHYYRRTDKARLWGLGFGEGVVDDPLYTDPDMTANQRPGPKNPQATSGISNVTRCLRLALGLIIGLLTGETTAQDPFIESSGTVQDLHRPTISLSAT